MGLRVEQLVQVCLRTADPKTKEREIRALLKASEEPRCTNLVVLTEDEARDEVLKIREQASSFISECEGILDRLAGEE